METKLLNIALSKLAEDVEKLNELVRSQEERIKRLESEKNAIKHENVVQQTFEEKIKSEYLDIKEVVSLLGVSYSTIKRILKKGLLERVQINDRRFKFSKTSILRYLATHTV